jgi:hypothetical protein
MAAAIDDAFACRDELGVDSRRERLQVSHVDVGDLGSGGAEIFDKVAALEPRYAAGTWLMRRAGGAGHRPAPL